MPTLNTANIQHQPHQELYQREWRYHVELKLWFRHATQQDLPHMQQDRVVAQYVFFDINSWECRLFSGNAHVVASGLMSEEEVRVRNQTPNQQQQSSTGAAGSSSASGGSSGAQAGPSSSSTGSSGASAVGGGSSDSAPTNRASSGVAVP